MHPRGGKRSGTARNLLAGAAGDGRLPFSTLQELKGDAGILKKIEEANWAWQWVGRNAAEPPEPVRHKADVPELR